MNGEEADGWHFDGVYADRPGKPPLAESNERICVENNGGFGNVAITSNQ